MIKGNHSNEFKFDKTGDMVFKKDINMFGKLMKKK